MMMPPAKSPRRPSSPSKEESAPSQVHRPHWHWHTILAGAALVAMVLAVYAPMLNAEYIWDDDSYVTGNLTLRTLDGLRRIWFELRAVPQYYPLVHTTFWIEYHLWDLAPLGYHVVNILLHAASALLVWRLLTRLRVPGAWLAAALFAVHPVEVGVGGLGDRAEERAELDAGAGLDAVPTCALRRRNRRIAASTPGEALAMVCVGRGTFRRSLLSKTVVATLPAVLLVIYWWKRGRIKLATCRRWCRFLRWVPVSG